jgi:hypothetical protein
MQLLCGHTHAYAHLLQPLNRDEGEGGTLVNRHICNHIPHVAGRQNNTGHSRMPSCQQLLLDASDLCVVHNGNKPGLGASSWLRLHAVA